MISSLNPSSGSPDRKNWLERYLKVQVRMDARVDAALAAASDSAEAALQALEGKNGIGASVRRAQILGSRGALTKVMNLLYREVGNEIRAGQAEAAGEAVKARFADDADVLERIISDPAKRSYLRAGMIQAADRNVQAMMTRILKTERTLSERVYHSKALANGQVSRLVNVHLARGSSAADIAKEVRQFILPTSPGGISYSAKRLARTEINNAFHAQSIADSQDRPWILEVKWNLSKSHPVASGCRCEVYARQGTFPVAAVPEKPHPNCLCYTVPQVEDWETFERNLLLGRYDNWRAEHE